MKNNSKKANGKNVKISNKKKLKLSNAMNDSIGCIGEFNPSSEMCNKKCALSLICSIEQEQLSRMEILEDLLYSDDMIQIRV